MPRYTDIDETFDPDVIVNSNRHTSPFDADPIVHELDPTPTPTPAPTVKQEQPYTKSEIDTPGQPETTDADNDDMGKTSFWNAVMDSRITMFIGVILFVSALYLAIVSVSYFYNITHDQSALISGVLTLGTLTNAGGAFGAYLAHTLLYEWVGLGAFIMIFWLAATGIKLVGTKSIKFWNLTFNCLVTIVTLSMVCGLITYEISTPIYWGGKNGHFLNKQIIDVAGIWGAVGVSVILIAAFLLLYLDTIKGIYRFILRHISNYSQRVAKARAESRQRAEASRPQADIDNTTHPVITDEPDNNRPTSDIDHDVETDNTKETEFADPDAPVTPDTPLFTTQEHTTDNVKESDLEPLFDNSGKSEPSTSVDTTSNTTVSFHTAETFDDISEIPVTILPDDVPAETDPEMEVELTKIEIIDTDTSRQSTTPKEMSEEFHLLDPRDELSHFKMPSIDLLIDRAYSVQNVDSEEMEINKQRIIKTLNDYGITISQIKATVGPTVTLYEIKPVEGTRIAKIKRLGDDIAMSVAALGIRIIAPMPGKGTIGIEVPNQDPQTVSMRSILTSKKFQEKKEQMKLPMAIGCTISNDVFIADLCDMPHLLVAGATGMGKSVGLNAIIASLLYTKHPAELKFVMIDPKMVEFSLYAKIENHYLAKLPDEDEAIITDPMKVVTTLNSLCLEMDNRYTLLRNAGACRNIKEYNTLYKNRKLNPNNGHRFLPYIVVVVDEFADLIMTAGKEVETPIARLAQKARAVGMHVILATQRPSTNVITGIIKANFPGRVAFRTFQMVDSRTILDRPGAEQLIGRGDMLFSNNGKIDRVQCAFIDTPEVEAICDAIASQPSYGHAYELPEFIPETDGNMSGATLGDRDPLFDEAARLVVSTDTASTSSLQRRYSIGYNRAGKIMDQMEVAGIVGPSSGGKPRQVLVDPVTLERILGGN